MVDFLKNAKLLHAITVSWHFTKLLLIWVKTNESFAKGTNESIRKSGTISNLQRDPVLEQFDSDNDEENGNGGELSVLEGKLF